MKNIQIYKLFSSPVFHYNLDNHKELNKELENYILSLKNQNKEGQKKSNIGGWHSPFFDIENNNVAKKFANIMEKFYKDVIMSDMGWKYENQKVNIEAMWSIINKKGSFNIQHNHPNSYLSAAYYVRHPEKSGGIKFYDPREQKSMRYPKIIKHGEFSSATVQIEPQEGDLLIFPSYLYHSVTENLSEKDRIIISFNIDIKYV
tara:strand:+ start:124 stop:732 length:609 start_codon:yes stop_codon:yes gene_type:complete